MSQKIYLTILKTGIYLSLVSVFLVFKGLLFPFITSKQISFNILIEILFIFWFAFIIKYPEYRPKKNWISLGLIGFFIAITISCFTAVDFNLSFWGDIERMLGVFHLLHFLALYFMIITVFKEWKDWKILFIISVVFAVIVSIIGLAGKDYSTIGNTAYVSGYLIFNMYFCLMLFFREKNKGWRWLYIIPIPIMLLEFEKASTTGAHVGLGFSIIILLLLYTLLNKNKKIKVYVSVAFLLAVLLVTLAFINKESDWVKNSSVLRMVGEVNIQKNTFQTRLISWKTAWKDFPEHPFLGTGHGNFAITFDKYFDPSFYNYTRAETYFDRAHNNLVDIASTAGLVGLLAYLSIFAAVSYYLIKGYLNEKINLHEFILITCLLVAYFVQNLAVFDSLVTYISLMIILGFIYWLYNQGKEENICEDKPFINKEFFVFLGAGLVILSIAYQCNIKPLKMLDGTIDGQIAYAQGDVVGMFETYKKALSYDTVLDRDSRNSLVRMFISNPSVLEKIDKKKAQEILNYLIGAARANVKYNVYDSINQMMLAQILNIASNYYSDNQEKFIYYSDQALEAINKSIEASPGRIPIYYMKAQILAARGEQDETINILEYAVSLNEDYYDSHCYLARFSFMFKQEEKGFKAMDKCVDKGGAPILSPAGYVASLIDYYINIEDWPRAIELYKRLSWLEPKNSDNWIHLAVLYEKVGDNEKAIEAAQKSAELDPSMKDAAEEFIENLR